MTTGQLLLAMGGGFAATLMAFQQTARQRGWPYGSVFRANLVPTVISLACFLAIVGRVIVAFASHSNGWSTASFALLGTFLGVAIFITVLGKNSGPIALVLAPTLCAASFFFA